MLNFQKAFFILLGCWVVTVLGVGVLLVQRQKPLRVQELNMKKWITSESLKEIQKGGQNEAKISQKLIDRLQQEAQDKGIIYVDKVWAHPQGALIQKGGNFYENF